MRLAHLSHGFGICLRHVSHRSRVRQASQRERNARGAAKGNAMPGKHWLVVVCPTNNNLSILIPNSWCWNVLKHDEKTMKHDEGWHDIPIYIYIPIWRVMTRDDMWRHMTWDVMRCHLMIVHSKLISNLKSYLWLSLRHPKRAAQNKALHPRLESIRVDVPSLFLAHTHT